MEYKLRKKIIIKQFITHRRVKNDVRGWERRFNNQVDQQRGAGYAKINSYRRAFEKVHTSENRFDHEASWMLIGNDRNTKEKKMKTSKHKTSENKRRKRRRFGVLIRLRDWPDPSGRKRQMIIHGWLGGEEESERHANEMILLGTYKVISKRKIATNPAVSVVFRTAFRVRLL